MIKLEMEVEEIRRQAFTWEGIEKTLQEDKKPEERDEKWYDTLRENTAYDKLLQFKVRHMKEVRVSGQSKRWWDEEINYPTKGNEKGKERRKEKETKPTRTLQELVGCLPEVETHNRPKETKVLAKIL